MMDSTEMVEVILKQSPGEPLCPETRPGFVYQ